VAARGCTRMCQRSWASEHDFRHTPCADRPARMATVQPETWLRVAGFGTWAVSSLLAGADLLQGQMSWGQGLLWLTAFVAFGASFALVCWAAWRARWVPFALLAVQTAAALALVWLGRDTLSAALLVVVAGQLPSFVPARVAAFWIGLQTVLLAAVIGRIYSVVPTVAVAAAFAGFQAFAAAMALLADRERTGREALASANADLRAARALVAESSRAAERLRISRDLHDTLGHHLTALSLQLDVASRLADGQAASHVHQAHAIARLLLADVRDAVSRLRDTGTFDAADAIRRLAPEGGALAVHLDAPTTLAGLDHDRAQVLVRCVQEVMTNALRHARADNLWITIVDGPDGVRVLARDDGQGTPTLTWGNGLRGMRERFEAYAGRLDVRTNAGGGFEVHGVMPGEAPPRIDEHVGSASLGQCLLAPPAAEEKT